jgi:hypothetical protein
MLIGYARVSTHDQTLNLQLDSLKKAGCSRIFEDHISGTKEERIGLTDAISHLRAGDTLVVWRLDRLGRSLRQSCRSMRHWWLVPMGATQRSWPLCRQLRRSSRWLSKTGNRRWDCGLAFGQLPNARWPKALLAKIVGGFQGTMSLWSALAVPGHPPPCS